MKLHIREPKFIAFDNGWEDGATGRQLTASAWLSSPRASEVKAYMAGWKCGKASVPFNLETNMPVRQEQE